MNIKLHIPNALTIANLLCGILGIQVVFAGNLFYGAILIGGAAVFDFLDGFVARMLKVSSRTGKQLDSLADMVSFGVLPGVIAFQLSAIALAGTEGPSWIKYLCYTIPALSALRLAKFNVDDRQTNSFIGLPTPANAILWASIPIVGASIFEGLLDPGVSEKMLTGMLLGNIYIIPVLAIITSLLLVANFPMFALKFEHFRWRENELRYVQILASVVLFIVVGFTALPLIIVLYVVLSLVQNLTKGNEV